MFFRLTIVAIGTFFVAGCSTPYWPGDATIDGQNFVDPVIEKRFEQASRKNPGTKQDLREIKRAILENDAGVKIVEIRWISETKAMAVTEGCRPYALFYYALEKKGRSWKLITRYLGAVE